MKLTWPRRALALTNSTATMVAYRKSSQSTFQAGEGRGHEELLAVDGVGRELTFFPERERGVTTAKLWWMTPCPQAHRQH